MRVLFVPAPEGGNAHLIPLLALNRLLAGAGLTTAFLLPLKAHRSAREIGVDVLSIDHAGYKTGFRTEMIAYARFTPDVVVDDSSTTTGFTTTLKKLPRVAIQRTGIFPGGVPRNRKHTHSGEALIEVKKLPDVTALGLAQPKTFADLFNGDVKIVPGIRSIEVLPDHLRNDPSYYYCGPLLTDDYLVQRTSRSGSAGRSLSDYQEFESLQRFFEANKGRKLVYATFGTIATAGPRLIGCIKDLVRKGIAVVTSLKLGENIEFGEGLYYQASYLPMHLVCSRADLMIHHCGSGTYHYPILH
jgi:hypothetical protein